MPYLVAALAALAAASYFDLRYREVPRWLTYGLIAAGIGLHGYESLMTASLLPLVLASILAMACFAFGYALYRLRAWAGGDVKLFTGLGATVPYLGGIYGFPFLVLGAALVAALPVMIAYVAYHLLTRPGLASKVGALMRTGMKRAVLSPLYLLGAYTACMLTAAPTFLSLPLAYILHEGREAGIFFTSFLVATAVLADSFLFATSFAYLLAISAMLFLGIASFRVAQQGILRQAVAVADLREGDMLARGIAGVPAMARGVTMAEISRLKKAGLKAVEIRKSAPFIPALFAGLAASAALTNLFI